MRTVFAAVVVLTFGVVGCDEDVSPPDETGIDLAFVVAEIPTWSDSAAYVEVTGPGRIDLVGFYTGCSYTIRGRLVEIEAPSIVVDAEISLCRDICIRNVHSRYRATITGIPPGDQRVILEHLIRACDSGELGHAKTVIDTVVTVPAP